MIQHIDVHQVLQKSVPGDYGDLVTRSTGRAVREEIERAMTGASVMVMDFARVGCVDYSCADEIVARLLRDRPSILLLRHLNDGHREAIEPVLVGHGLAVLIEHAGGLLEGLGAAAAAQHLLDTLVAQRLAARTPGGEFAFTPA